MGMQTTLVIKNDALNAVDSDPKGWWEKTSQLIQRHIGRNSEEYGFGYHGNGFEIVSVHHADDTTLIAVGQNHSTVLGKFPHQFHHTEEHQLELIKRMADKMGYRLVKKNAAKTP